MSDVKLQRTVARFQAKIESGAYDEAHQTLRTMTNRYVKLKQYQDALDLLYQGASTLANKKEYASALDLITYYIQILEEATLYDKQYKLKIIELVNVLPDTETALVDISKQAITWSTKGVVDLKFGDPELHHTFGIKFANGIKSTESTDEEERLKLFANAELHLILGTHDSMIHYIDFLIEWYLSLNGKSNPSYFLARAVYNYAYLKNIKFVQEAITRFTSSLQIHRASDVSPLEANGVTIYRFENDEFFEFLQLLALTLSKKEAGQKFMKLYGQYKPKLIANEYLAPTEYLGRFYFGLNLGSTGGNNMFANLMGGLFN